MSLKEFSLPEYCLDGENVLDHLGEVVAMDLALGTDYAATIVEATMLSRFSSEFTGSSGA